MNSMKYFIHLGGLLFFLLAFGCLRSRVLEDPQITRLRELQEKKRLYVVTVNSPTTYFEDAEEHPSGPEYDLISSFAKEYGLIPEFIVAENVSHAIKLIRDNQAHLAAAGLTITSERKEFLEFGPSYQQVEEWVICHNKVNAKNFNDLQNKRIRILAGSSYENKIRRFNITPLLQEGIFTQDLSTDEILQYIWERKLDCTVLDHHVFSVYQRYMPELKKKIKLKGDGQLAWAIAPGSEQIKGMLEEWFAKAHKSGFIKDQLDKYYAYREDFDYFDTKVFLKRIKKRLTPLIPLFKEAAKSNGLDWRLLASVAYQESHWISSATSPTGVRGMMMLTSKTAKELNIKDRLNAKESIFGGARYLKKAIERIPKYIPPKDRLWMGVAGYNVGHYHVRDARALAIWQNKNPNIWSDIREVLPLLSKRKYFKNLPYGRARGLEPVVYVKRIKGYYDLMLQQFPVKKNEL